MAEFAKSIIIFVLAFSVCIISISIAYSMSTRGSAEFRFYYEKEREIASYTHGMGFNCWGYHIEVFNDKGK